MVQASMKRNEVEKEKEELSSIHLICTSREMKQSLHEIDVELENVSAAKRRDKKLSLRRK